MKNYFSILILSFALTQSVFAQTDKKQIIDIEKAIQDIKNNIGSFQKIEKYNDNSGHKYYFVKDKQLQLVTVDFQDDNINKKVEWYFSNGKLIYSEQIWTDTKSKNIIDNERFYLSNDKLISWIKESQAVENNSREFQDTNTQLALYGEKLLSDFK